MKGRGWLAGAALTALVVGAVLMIPFEHPVTRALGVLALFAWIVLGAFAVATPSYLARDTDPDD